MTSIDIFKIYPESNVPEGLGEMVPIVNMQDEVQGIALKKAAHKYDLKDRIAAVMLRTPDLNGFFFQQRALHKDPFPGAYTLAATGHVNFNNSRIESYEEAAQREFREEMGLECPPLKHMTTFPINAGHNGIYAVFNALHTGDVTDFAPNPEEVKGVILLSRRQLPGMSDKFTPPARRILERMALL